MEDVTERNGMIDYRGCVRKVWIFLFFWGKGKIIGYMINQKNQFSKA